MTHEKVRVEKVPGRPIVPLKKVFLFACYSCLPAGLCDIDTMTLYAYLVHEHEDCPHQADSPL